MRHAYPAQLASFVQSRWGEGAPPSEAALEAILSIAYQASLLREEDRPVTFRLLVADPEAIEVDASNPDGLHRLVFEARRAFEEHELRRLSQAAKYHRALIAVSPPGGERDAEIWGIVQTGPRWLPSARTGEVPPPSLPADALVVRVGAPGRLAVARGDVTLAEIRGGIVSEPAFDIFQSRWLPARFADIRKEILDEHKAAVPFPRRVLGDADVRGIGQDVLRRTLAIMREAKHGGTLIILAPGASESARLPHIDLKYALLADDGRRRYHGVILALLRALAVEGSSSTSSRAAAQEAVFELAQVMAALADVDGAVVLTRRFEILGFGAEIVGDLPSVDHVGRALDLEATARVNESVHGVGTRHRSAYRLVAAVPDALAIVVSQDGSARFVAQVDGEVTTWDHAAAGDLGV